MPMAFQVVTRAIVFEISRLIQGSLVQYVGVDVVCSHKRCTESDKEIVFNFLMVLLGPNSIGFKKFKLGCTLDFIGYSINLEYDFVGVSDRKTLKAIYAVMNVDLAVSALVPLKTME
jgi:hypothetical protein